MPRHRTHHFLVMFCIIVSSFVISPAMAQEAEQPVTTLDTIYVTDRPIIEGNRTDEYGSVKTVITEEQLEDLNAQDIETALRLTPGINMSRFNPVGSFGGAEGGGIFSEYAPHAGLVAKYGPAEFYVGYARGVLYPGLEVQVMSEAVIPALGTSWEELNPEVVDHYEVGMAYAFSRQLTADLILFYEDGRDRYVIVPPPPFPPTYDNVEEFTIQGHGGHGQLATGRKPVPVCRRHLARHRSIRLALCT